MRPSERGLERETNPFKTAKNYSNGLASYRNVSRIKSGIPSMDRGKHTWVNIDTK